MQGGAGWERQARRRLGWAGRPRCNGAAACARCSAAQPHGLRRHAARPAPRCALCPHTSSSSCRRASLAGLEDLSHRHHAAARDAQRRQVHLAVLLQVALQAGRARGARMRLSTGASWGVVAGRPGAAPSGDGSLHTLAVGTYEMGFLIEEMSSLRIGREASGIERRGVGATARQPGWRRRLGGGAPAGPVAASRHRSPAG